MAFFVLAIFVTSLAGCGDDGGSAADAATGQIDAAVSIIDASQNLPDAPGPDAATADAAVPDASPADAEIGPDAASPDADVPDAGPLPDAMPNPDVAIACEKVCATLAQCGEDDATCKTECMEEVGPLCSPDEVDDLLTCAGAACQDLEQCILQIPCIGTGEEFCGNGTCETGEDCGSCPGDCGQCVCGDGTCSVGECSTCAADCPDGCSCGDVCAQGPAQDPSCGSCQAQVCAVDSYCCTYNWDGICVSEAIDLCNADCPVVCGDGLCGPDEQQSCPDDCFFPDGGVPPPPGDVDAGAPMSLKATSRHDWRTRSRR